MQSMSTFGTCTYSQQLPDCLRTPIKSIYNGIPHVILTSNSANPRMGISTSNRKDNKNKIRN